MRKINKMIPCAVLRSVAKTIVETYPDVFEDRKMGKKFGNGYTNLYNSLLNHSNYQTAISKATDNKTPKRKAKNLKFITQAKLGALKWNLEHYREGKNELTMETRRQSLYDAYKLIDEQQAPPINLYDEISENLNKSFKAQRDFFNDFENLPNAQSMFIKWPVLSIMECLFYHYSLLMGHSIELLKNDFINDKKTIFAFGKASNLTQAETPDDSFEMIQIIFNYFKEDFSNYFVSCPVRIYF